jgi:TLC domain
MDLWIYIMGSLYAVSALFRFSYSYSKYLLERRFFGWVDQETCAKINYQRVDEWIYSTIHSLFIILLTGYSLQDHVLGSGIKGEGDKDCPDSVKLTLALSLSYFSLDLVKCVLRLNYPFILHHLCAINLLMTSMDQIGNGSGNGKSAGSYLMAYLLLLEVNTPLMNLGFLLKAFNFDYNIYGTVWSLHLISYILCRLVMVPYLTYYYYQNLSNDGEESLYYQIPNLLIIYLGSSYWAYRQVMGIQRRVLGNL